MASFSDMTNWQNWSPTFARIYLDVSRSSPSWTAGTGSHRLIAMESLCWGLRKPSTRSTPLRVKANLVAGKNEKHFVMIVSSILTIYLYNFHIRLSNAKKKTHCYFIPSEMEETTGHIRVILLITVLICITIFTVTLQSALTALV